MNYFIYTICGFLGLLAVVLINAIQLQTSAIKANIEFSFEKYLKKDALSILLSAVAVVSWLLLFSEAAQQSPRIQNMVRLTFFAMGGLGSWIIQTFFGNTRKWINNIVDHKTNELDKIKDQQ